MSYKSRSLIFTYFVIALLLITIGCNGGYDAETGLYEGKGIRILFPPGWAKAETIPSGTLTIESPDKSAQISLLIQDLPENVTFEQYLKHVESGMGIAGVRENDSGTIDLGGYEGVWSERTLKLSGVTFESINYYVMRGNRVYTIIATAYEDSFEDWTSTFDKVAQSVNFTD